MKSFIKHMLFGALLLPLAACQTPRYKYFEAVRPGMTKGMVLETAGGPDRSMRFQGKDRWVYVYQDHPEGPQVREVHFDGGKAVYVGDRVKPQLSAEEQDQKNESANHSEVKRLEEIDSNNPVQVGKARVGDGLSSSADSVDDYIQESIYGKATPDTEKKKRAPRFEPIN